jgi:hypothetical protein
MTAALCSLFLTQTGSGLTKCLHISQDQKCTICDHQSLLHVYTQNAQTNSNSGTKPEEDLLPCSLTGYRSLHTKNTFFTSTLSTFWYRLWQHLHAWACSSSWRHAKSHSKTIRTNTCGTTQDIKRSLATRTDTARIQSLLPYWWATCICFLRLLWLRHHLWSWLSAQGWNEMWFRAGHNDSLWYYHYHET